MRYHNLEFVILCGAFLLSTQAVNAALTVCNSGCDYTNIQDAVTAASDGEVIQIRQGVFIGSILINDKNLTLKGSGSSVTIINRGPSGVSPAPPAINVSCTSTHKIIISNVTITGGIPYRHFGGGGVINDNCDVTLNNTLVTNNTSRGGGIFNEGVMKINSSVISGNAAELGGGGINNDGKLFIINSLIVGNNTKTPGKGGGIVNGGTLEVRSSTITQNEAPDGGGFANAVGGKALFINTVIVNNITFGEGGGLWNVGNLKLNRSLVIGNSAGNEGGGIYQKTGGILNMKNSTLINNLAGTTGGGLYADGAVTANSNTIIQGNTPDNCAGGAFVCP